MPKKIGAIGSEDDKKDIDIALQMTNNPSYRQKTEQKDKNQSAQEVQDIKAAQQKAKTQYAYLSEEQQRLQDIQNINTKPATGENVSGSIYSDGAIKSGPTPVNNNGIRKLNSEKEVEIIKNNLIKAKQDIPKFDGELAQKSSFAAMDGTPARDALKVMDAVQTEIKKNDDIAQQYITQAETLMSQYANTSMVHELKHDKQLGNQMKDSTKKFNPDANLNNKVDNDTQKTKEKELKEKEKFKGYK